MSTLGFVAAVNKKVKGLVEDGLFAAFFDNLTSDRLVRNPKFKVGIHGKKGGGLMLDFCVDDGDSEYTINCG